MLYCYLKAKPRIKRQWRLVSLSMVAVGSVLLANVFLPLFVYQLQSNHLNIQILSPLADNSAVLGVGLSPFDSTKPDTWFPKTIQSSSWQSKITHYNLSVPKLKIKDAIVEVGGDDLKQSLVHYPGTALPGQYGNAVVFGHSVLPQFFNPKSYKTIFSTLPTLNKGDEVLVDFDGVTYRYRVVSMTEVAPEDVTVLEQRYDAEYLSLITCVPPGTYLRRLVVKSRLVRF